LILHDPIHFFRHVIGNIGVHLWLDFESVLGLSAALLVFVGLLRLVLFPPTRRQLAFYFFPFCYFLAMCLVYHQPRFSLTLLPAYFALGFSLIWSPGSNRAAGWTGPWRDRVQVAWSKLPERGFSSVRVLAIILVCVGLLISQITLIVQAERYYYVRRPLYILAAAAHMRNLIDDMAQGAVTTDRTVMAAKAHLAFYADRPFVPYPVSFTSRRDLIDKSVALGVGYLQYGDIERQYYPEATVLARLADVQGIEKIYEQPEIIIFELDHDLDPENLIWNATIARGLSQRREAEAAGRLSAILEANTRLADLYMQERDWPTAARWLREGLVVVSQLPDAVDTAQKRADLQFDLSLCLWYLGRNEEGIELLNEPVARLSGMEKSEKLPLAHALLGRHLADLGRDSEAILHFRQARDLYNGLGDQNSAEAMERILVELMASP
jgi:tetratricopeptide (TPR) repeat protein